MQSWRKLFVVGTLKQFSSKDFMNKPCWKGYANMRVPIKMLRLLPLKNKNKTKTTTTTSIIILQIPSVRSEREKNKTKKKK